MAQAEQAVVQCACGCQNDGGRANPRAILRHERFQEALGLAKGPCPGGSYASRINGHPATTFRGASESVSTGSDVGPANIAEGRRQESEKDFARFLRYSLNSAFELEYHLIVARDVAAISESDSAALLAEAIEVRKMLYGLLNRIAETPRFHTRQPE